jgi:hypothetical protein
VQWRCVDCVFGIDIGFAGQQQFHHVLVAFLRRKMQRGVVDIENRLFNGDQQNNGRAVGRAAKMSLAKCRPLPDFGG